MNPRAPTDPIAITLEAQQWNVVIGALVEAPWRIADPVLRAITSQTTKLDEEAELVGQAPPSHKGNGELRQDDAAAPAKTRQDGRSASAS